MVSEVCSGHISTLWDNWLGDGPLGGVEGGGLSGFFFPS